MKNQVQINELLDSLMFILEVDDETSMDLDKENPYKLNEFVDNVIDEHKQIYDNLETDEQSEVSVIIKNIKEYLDEHNSQEQCLTKDELKQVYVWLKERKLHPQGKFNDGRFYLKDKELVDVREPSRKFPYTQMVAGRSSKFVKAMAEKYKPTSLKEFLDLFVIAEHKEIKGYFNEN